MSTGNDYLKNHMCQEDLRWPEYDARGIFLCYVCDACRKAKLSRYRPEIFTGYSQEDTDEPIYDEDEGWDKI